MDHKLFIHRYTDDEIMQILESLNDPDWDVDLKIFLLSDGCTRCLSAGKVLTPDKRKGYLKSYEEYTNSDMPFTVLKYDKCDENISHKYFRWMHMLIHILEIPISEIPLYINSKEPWIKFFAKQRLIYGK